MIGNESDSLNDQSALKTKRRIRNIILITVPIIVITVVVVLVVKFTKKKSEEKETQSTLLEITTKYNLSTFFFFDPISNNPCNEKNYWTPFDNTTTCYRWISITPSDTNESSTIKLMLDHNIATSTFYDYKNILKNKTSNWSRYKDIIDIIDEDTIYNLMQYPNKPDKINKVVPSVIINPFSSQSYYIIEGKGIDQKGYWTKTSFDEESAYTIDYNGNNEVITKSQIYGIRPIINIQKNLLNIDSGVIDITEAIKNWNYIHYDIENKLYDGYKYEVLQGFTVSNDKLFFMSSNNNNPEKGVLYSYKFDDIQTLYKWDYSNTGHGNGMTYNSKTGKVLTLGYYGVCEYNENTLIREKDYNRPIYVGYSAIGYDYNTDLYIGRANHRIFFADTINMKKKYEFPVFMFEAGQDLEYYKGYIFDCATDFGLPNPYQKYSFYPGYELIYIYDAKFDENNKPTKNFGRLIKRFIMKGFGELESISFRKGNVYLGFGKNGYNFYYKNYDKFMEEIGVSI